jgi:L-lysine exporter family protein LysE/ArgO
VSFAVAAVLGLGLGVITGMPLGVVNVAIVDAAVAGRRRFATGIGLGGAVADAAHATLALVGLGRVVTAHPAISRGLALAAAVLIVGYAITAWRRRVLPRAIRDESRLGPGLATGVALTLPNPGALAAWVAVGAALWPDATVGEAIVFGVGVGAGSALWFSLLAHFASRVPREHRALAIVPRAALVAFVAIAVVGVVRVLVS